MKIHQSRFPAGALLLLATAACGGPVGKQSLYCSPATDTATAVTEPVVVRAAPSRARMGRHLQVRLRVPPARPDLKDLRLYIDGHPVPGLAATQIGARCALTGVDRRTVTGYLESYEFIPVRNEQSKAMWAHLLGSPTAFVDPVQVGAGLVNGPEFKTAPALESTRVAFTVADETMFWIVAAVTAALFALLVWAGIRTPILRDPTPVVPSSAVPDPDTPEAGRVAPGQDAAGPPPPKPPYSLAKVVMAMWTFLILGGFFGIWLITGDPQGIFTPQALLLLGITGVSTAASVAITNQKNEPASTQGRELRMRSLALRRYLKRLNDREKAGVGLDEHEELERRAAQRDAVMAEDALAEVREQAPASRQFFVDLISDANGPALYRFQNLLWNVTLAIVFIVGTYRALAFPHLDPSLMALMGISESVYLGVKLASPGKSAANQEQRASRTAWARRPAAS